MFYDAFTILTSEVDIIRFGLCKPKTILVPWMHQYCIITIHSFMYWLYQ